MYRKPKQSYIFFFSEEIEKKVNHQYNFTGKSYTKKKKNEKYSN